MFSNGPDYRNIEKDPGEYGLSVWIPYLIGMLVIILFIIFIF